MTKTNNIFYLYEKTNDVEFIFCDNSTISYPLHNHVSVFTIGMVLEGSIVLSTNQSSHIYNEGQSFTIFPYIPHSIKANNQYTLISICIHKNSLDCSHCDIDKIKIDITNILIKALGLSKINQNQITQLLNCLNCFSDSALPLVLDTNTRMIDDLKQQLELFPERKFSIEEMAHSAFISKYHFIRSFKQLVGLTPHQFQLQNRIRKAQKLINNNNVNTLAEIALATGFCDQSHFIKQFEKRVGLTPTIYKRSCGSLNPDFTA